MKNSTVIPPTGISLSEDVDATYGFIFTEYDQNLRVLRGCHEGSKSPKKVVKRSPSTSASTFSFITQLSFQLQSSPRDYPETHLVASF